MTLCPAIVLNSHGGPEVLEERVLDVPEPGPGQVRVRVRAVAMNHLDLWVRRGLANLKLSYPHRLGSDISGEIDAVGQGVEGVRRGQKALLAPGVSCGRCQECLSGNDNLCRSYGILGETTNGGYAMLLNVPATNVLPYPEGLSWEQAASLPLSFLTAWQMVVLRARVQPGELVLVQGAGSGVGVAAVQIARLFGARVWATAGNAEKCARAKELGAEEAFDYSSVDFVQEVRTRTGKRGVDVVIEHVGGEVFTRSLQAVCRGGRVVTCGATAGFTPAIDLRQIFFRNVQVMGSTMGPRAALFDVVKHVERGALKPVVSQVFPLAKVREAHALLEARGAFGKVVLLHP